MIKRGLVEVDISGLGVIDSAHFAPGPGFTVITGETGAGKTMVLSALSLLMGSRADAAVVRAGSERATVVGRFAISEELAAKVNELGGEVEGEELLLSRTVTSEGKSRASVGGIPSTISSLAEIGNELLSIHGQSTHFTLLKPQRAREILDQFGGQEIQNVLQDFSKLFAKYREISENIVELEELHSTREREIERLTTFLLEYDRIKPTPRESQNLREKILALENIDGTRAALAGALEVLSDGEINISSQIALVKRSLESTTSQGEISKSTAALAREISILVNELTSSLRRYQEELDLEPGALERMHERRAAVLNFIKRFGDAKLEDPEGVLIEEERRGRALLAQLSGGDQGLSELHDEKKRVGAQLCTASLKLSVIRREVGLNFAAAISEELTHLAMPNARIDIAITQITEGLAVSAGDDQPGSSGSLLCSPSGSDEVNFQLVPHVGATALPINKGASGGELSRIMLAIEVVLAGRSSIPTYLFDEVDVGVGGKAAVEVGRRLALLAQHAQVLVVTHLPQVAAWADTHFTIRKKSTETLTSSDLTPLEAEERAHELARMMAGREESDLARQHARELLDFVALERVHHKSFSGKRA